MMPRRTEKRKNKSSLPGLDISGGVIIGKNTRQPHKLIKGGYMKLSTGVALVLLSICYTAQAEYVLNEKETALLENLLKDEIKNFSHDGSTAFWPEYPAIKILDISKDYAENQVAGDQKYFNKRLRIYGTISAINSGLGNLPYLAFKESANPFLQPQAHFTADKIPQIAKLKKNYQICLVCTGAGCIAGTPIFNNCMFAKEFAETSLQGIRKDIERFLSGQDCEKDYVQMLVIVAACLAKELPHDSTCFSDGTKCPADIVRIKKKNLEPAKKTCIEDLKKAGLKIKDK